MKKKKFENSVISTKKKHRLALFIYPLAPHPNPTPSPSFLPPLTLSLPLLPPCRRLPSPPRLLAAASPLTRLPAALFVHLLLPAAASPLFSRARLPAPHASARHGPAWIWRLTAYLPRLLVGERVLEVLLLPPASPSAPPAGRGPHCSSGVEARAASPTASAAACSSGIGGEGRVAFSGVDPVGRGLLPAAAGR